MSKNSTTWTNVNNTWRHGKTKTIRVPIALADQILEYARTIDGYDTAGKSASFVNNQAHFTLSGSEVFILEAIERYIDWKRTNYHPNQNSKRLDINTRAWDELRKFQSMIKNEPEKLFPPTTSAR